MNQYNECIIYLETIRKVGERMYNVYVDFRLERDFILFRKSYQGNANCTADVSYIELLNLKTSKRLFSGCYYKLNLQELLNYSSVELDSLFIAKSYDLSFKPFPTNDDQEILQKHSPLDSSEILEESTPLKISLPQMSDLSLKVRDVGQANWNELLEGQRVRIVYDLGAPLRAGKNEVKNYFEQRRKDYVRDKPVLVISHWDMDHIHCLRYLDSSDISDCFSQIICLNNLKSMTSKRLCRMLKTALLGRVSCLNPYSRKSRMHLCKRVSNISLYKGPKSRNINYAGLCLFVRGNQKSAVFTGDLKLSQVHEVLEQEMAVGLTTSEHV